MMLAAMSGCHEHPCLPGAVLRYQDVARLVGQVDCVDDLPSAGPQIDADHAYAVGDMVDHPERGLPLRLAHDGDGDGPHAHLHRATQLHAVVQGLQ